VTHVAPPRSAPSHASAPSFLVFPQYEHAAFTSLQSAPQLSVPVAGLPVAVVQDAPPRSVPSHSSAPSLLSLPHVTPPPAAPDRPPGPSPAPPAPPPVPPTPAAAPPAPAAPLAPGPAPRVSSCTPRTSLQPSPPSSAAANSPSRRGLTTHLPATASHRLCRRT